MIKKYSWKKCAHLHFFSLFLISLTNSSCNSNGDFFLIFGFDGSVSGSSSATFLLASRIIELKSSTNLIVMYVSSVKKLIKISQCFFLDLFPILIFLDIS